MEPMWTKRVSPGRASEWVSWVPRVSPPATLEDIRSRGVRVAEPLEVFDAALRSAVRIGSMSASFLVGRRVGSGGGARHLCCK